MGRAGVRMGVGWAHRVFLYAKGRTGAVCMAGAAGNIRWGQDGKLQVRSNRSEKGLLVIWLLP